MKVLARLPSRVLLVLCGCAAQTTLFQPPAERLSIHTPPQPLHVPAADGTCHFSHITPTISYQLTDDFTDLQSLAREHVKAHDLKAGAGCADATCIAEKISDALKAELVQRREVFCDSSAYQDDARTREQGFNFSTFFGHRFHSCNWILMLVWVWVWVWEMWLRVRVWCDVVMCI